MTRDERIVEAIAHYQQRFRLGDWQIAYESDNTHLGKNHLAITHIRNHQRCATIRIDSDAEADIERIVVHELMHLVLYDFTELAGHVITKQKGGNLGVIDWLSEGVERICEQVAEAMTGVPWRPYGKRTEAIHAPFLQSFVSSQEAING